MSATESSMMPKSVMKTTVGGWAAIGGTAEGWVKARWAKRKVANNKASLRVSLPAVASCSRMGMEASERLLDY